MSPVVSRAAARAAGAVTYFTGRPCKNGHLEPRAVSNSTCLACHRDAMERQRARDNLAAAGRPAPGACEACGGSAPLLFDHHHQSGRFRGWICGGCNLALGHAKDSPARLRALAEYLEKHHGKTDDQRAKEAAIQSLRRA